MTEAPDVYDLRKDREMIRTVTVLGIGRTVLVTSCVTMEVFGPMHEHADETIGGYQPQVSILITQKRVLETCLSVARISAGD